MGLKYRFLRCWVELIKDFDCVINYHPEKANVVTYALTRKNKVVAVNPDECDSRELIELGKINAKIEVGPGDSLLAQLKIKSIFQDRVLDAQMKDAEVKKVRDKVESGVKTPFQILNDGMVVIER
jgi:hypothetical protein